MSFDLWTWDDTINAPELEMAAWRNALLADRIAEFSDQSVYIETGVGKILGGRVGLNHSVLAGLHENAGAFGALTVSAAIDSQVVLIDGVFFDPSGQTLCARPPSKRRGWAP